MKCHQARQLFFLYYDSELDPRSVEEVNLHLEACPACRERWGRETRLEEAIDRAARATAASLDDFPWSELEARVRGGRASRSAARAWIAAAVLVLLGLSGWLVYLAVDHHGADVADVARSAAEHHDKYLSGKSPVQVRGPDAEAVRNFYAGELGFEVVVPNGSVIKTSPGTNAELLGARRCTFLGGPVAYVSYRIADKDVTAILGPLKPPDAVLEAIRNAPDGILESDVGACRVLIASVRGLLFVAAGRAEPAALRGLLEAFQTKHR
jgi:anti-sigma factor RsiW